MSTHHYDPETRRWQPSCPFGDVCSGCDAAGYCTRAEAPAGIVNRLGSTDAGSKDDGSKPRTDLLPVDGLIEVAHVFGFGAEKYGDYNWHGLSVSRLYAAALRHLFAWWRGEETDADTGRSHLAHAACCVLMVLEQMLHRAGQYDDRPGR